MFARPSATLLPRLSRATKLGVKPTYPAPVGHARFLSQSSALQHQHTHHGSCHCGSIHVTFETDKTPAQLGARTCQCSFCRLHDGSFTSDTDGALTIKTDGTENRYRMGTGTAEFFICTNCGVVPAATWRRDDGKLLSVVRVHCLPIKKELFEAERKHDVDHENWEQRSERRGRTWTPTTVNGES